jgi:Protein of unknown function (DUF2975)
MMMTGQDDVQAHEESYRMITQIARWAEWASLAGIALIVGSFGYLWLDSGRLLNHLMRDMPEIMVPPSGSALYLAGLAGMIPAFLLILALWQVRVLFTLYRTRQIFAPDIPVILVRLGTLAISAAAASIVVRTINTLLLTLRNPPGYQHISVGFGSNEMLALIAGLLLWCFSLVMKESRRIADENKSFV